MKVKNLPRSKLQNRKISTRKILTRSSFSRVRKIIEIKRQSEPLKYEIGKKREDRVTKALQELKNEGDIRDFLETGDLSFQDIMKGIDFFVVYVDDKSYRVLSLSVTGERWIGKHRGRHPEIPVIAVDIFETLDSIKSKIMEAIRNGGDKK